METDIKFSKACKELMMKELSDKLRANPDFILTNYFGLSSNQMNELRSSLAKVSSKYFVVKNRLFKKVLKDFKIDQMKGAVADGIGITFIAEDSALTTKLIVDFSKKYESFKIKGAYIDGRVMDTSKVKQLACLPSKEVLLFMIVTTMNAPISGFVNVLAGVMRKFVYAVNAIKDKKQG